MLLSPHWDSLPYPHFPSQKNIAQESRTRPVTDRPFSDLTLAAEIVCADCPIGTLIAWFYEGGGTVADDAFLQLEVSEMSARVPWTTVTRQRRYDYVWPKTDIEDMGVIRPRTGHRDPVPT